MKLKYLLSGAFLLVTALFAASCDDDVDYTVRTGEIVSEITTGEASVTAVSAEIRGTVRDLTLVASSAYEVGAYYGTTSDPVGTGTKKIGSVDENGNITVSLTGLTTGETYYYATYVILGGKVSYYGDVKSFVATQAMAVTRDASGITFTKATLEADITGTDGVEDVETGVRIALSADDVREGTLYDLGTVTSLLPGTTYYYAAFVKVGEGYVYGETKSFSTEVQTMEYVDLGLSVLWSTCNIGADVESEAGALFGYGDPTAMETSVYTTSYPATTIAGTSQDAIYGLTLDGDNPMKSQMPTQAHIAELLSKTTQEWTTVDGVEGMRFTAPNGNSIFLPVTGYRDGENAVADGKGYYWSGTISATNSDYANTLAFDGGAANAGFSGRALGLAIRPVRPYAEVVPNGDNIAVGDIEGNGNLRIEIYNVYGPTSGNPSLDAASIKFTKNMVVNFTLTGIDGNLVADAQGSYVAGLEYADATWDPSYWSSLEKGKYEAIVQGDGTYTVWMEVAAQAEGFAVFCVDIKGLGADIVDMSQVGVTVNYIKLDADVEQVVNADIVEFKSKDGDGTNGRIEIYNEYGDSGNTAPGYYNGTMKFNGLMLVEFTISGIDGNLVEGATADYFTELSFADASWDPSYWGGAGYGSTNVTGDGTYQVYTYLNGDCEGAVVWTIELYGLWKDLVDTSKVNVKINKVITPGKF